MLVQDFAYYLPLTEKHPSQVGVVRYSVPPPISHLLVGLEDTVKFEVRPPLPAEARAWEQLRITSWREAYAGDFTPEVFKAQESQLEARAEGFAQWLESTAGTGEDVQPQLGQRRRALVAVRSAETVAAPQTSPADLGGLLGLAFATRIPYEVQKLEMLYLHPQAFGTGIAHALLSRVLDPGPAELEVLTTNARAIRFYEKEGFVQVRTDRFAGRKTYIMARP